MQVQINPIMFKLLTQLKPSEKQKPHHVEADPIRDEQDIKRAKEWFKSQPQRYRGMKLNIRNYLLFIIGINCGRRISDIRNLKIGDLVNEDGTYKTYWTLKEQKTGKPIKIYINDAVKEGLSMFLPDNPDLNAHLFQSRTKSHITKNGINEDDRLSIHQINTIYRKMSDEIGLTQKGLHITTHSARKTAVYRMIKSSPNDIRTLMNVQKFCNHSDFNTTLRYAGIQQEEIDNLVKNINI